MKSFVCLLRGDYKGTSGEVDVRFRPVEWRPKNLYTHTTIKEKSFLEKNSFTVLYQFETKWQCAVPWNDAFWPGLTPFGPLSSNSRMERTRKIKNFTGVTKNKYGPILSHFLPL